MVGRKATSNPAVAVALVALLVVATASGAAGFVVCKVNTNSMKAACSSYCAVGSTEERPKKECCKAVEHADFGCLCTYKGALQNMGNIDPDRAMQIPSKCNVPGAPTSC